MFLAPNSEVSFHLMAKEPGFVHWCSVESCFLILTELAHEQCSYNCSCYHQEIASSNPSNGVAFCVGSPWGTLFSHGPYLAHVYRIRLVALSCKYHSKAVWCYMSSRRCNLWRHVCWRKTFVSTCVPLLRLDSVWQTEQWIIIHACSLWASGQSSFHFWLIGCWSCSRNARALKCLPLNK